MFGNPVPKIQVCEKTNSSDGYKKANLCKRKPGFIKIYWNIKGKQPDKERMYTKKRIQTASLQGQIMQGQIHFRIYLFAGFQAYLRHHKSDLVLVFLHNVDNGAFLNMAWN